MPKLTVTGPASWVDPLTGSDGVSRRRTLKTLSIPATIKRKLRISDGQTFQVRCRLGRSMLSFRTHTTSGGELVLPKKIIERLAARTRGDSLRLEIDVATPDEFTSIHTEFRRSLAVGGALDRWLRNHPECKADREKEGHVIVHRDGKWVTFYEREDHFAFLTTDLGSRKINGSPSFRLQRGSPLKRRARRVKGGWFITVKPQRGDNYEIGPLNSIGFFDSIFNKAFSDTLVSEEDRAKNEVTSVGGEPDIVLIDWKDSELGEDLIPLSFLTDAGDNRRHFIRVNGRLNQAKCNIAVAPGHAILDYAAHRSFNDMNDIEIGWLRIAYKTLDTTDGWVVAWKKTRGAIFEKEDVDVQLYPSSMTAEDLDLVESVAQEGRRRFARHLVIERDRSLVAKKKLATKLATGALACEVCALDFAKAYPGIGDEYCEIHHRNPLHAGERVTTLNDLAVLCANCHRMIHYTHPIMSIEEFKKAFGRARN